MAETKHIVKFYCIIILVFFGLFNLQAQWAYDPSTNTKLVVNPVDPINISAVSDRKGGAFIVWQDSKSKDPSDVLFLHVNKDGETSFRSDGKAVSQSLEIKFEPKIILLKSGDLIVTWKEIISSVTSEIFVQKLSNKGLRLWSEFGIQVTRLNKEIKEYFLNTDLNGNIIISFIAKELNSPLNSLFIVKLDTIGKIINGPQQIISSNDNLSDVTIHQPKENFYYINWLETKESRATLYSGKVEIKQDSVLIQKKNVSKPNENVLSFESSLLGNDLYLIWYSQEKQRAIYHQLVSSELKFIWGQDGKLVTTKRGQNSNPQFDISGKNIFVTWVNNYGNDKNIYAQLFDLKGNKLWKEVGMPVIEFVGDQFGQKVISDNRGNFIIAWIDRRFTKQFGNIYAQKLNAVGEIQWTENGIDLGTYRNSEKSYLNLISDEQGGVIAIFKDKREKKSEIFGQKIFSTGTYAGQILGLKSEPVEDSVKVFWFAANETDEVIYEIQRKNEKENEWKTISTLSKGSSTTINYYEYKDFPGNDGLVSYRVYQKFKNKDQYSETVSVEIYAETGDYILYQNVPNPFTETTSISFILPKEEYVEIEFYDVRLNPIGTITQKIFPKGKNTVSFDAKRLSSGVYFYKMKAGDFVAVKKMVVSK
ncbi:T9SS type A sorting domain-containing protein [Ignavibacterium sp.]|uniref:T9SS type A sorting domain-containing protein n=1 Tax=Ignavibacterium sp. TaxID=2651167 RepID=UPI00307D6783